MPFNVSTFKSKGMQFQGARPTQFEVYIYPPFTTAAANRVQFTCRAASIPPAPLDSIPVPYFGRHIKVAGDRDFPDWNVTIMNDDDYAVRVMLESWSNRINYFVSNTMDESLYPAGYKGTAQVIQYNKIGNPIRAYNFIGIFPTNVDAIPLDWDQTNTIEQFDVTFAYDWYEPDQSILTTADDFTGLSPSDGVGT
jgi:hypothetical protein